ncbi:Lrp/AsnC family transcriptional regulator [Candidatus Gracilibacteria bacterium]|nr:Lrp/AsnC family transcriptional regulator [Candidatus Gracilibacteria bacterium]
MAERVRRLEALGVIEGYHALVDPSRLGLPVHCLIRISGVAETAPQVSAGIAAIDEVIECHRVTGEDSYMLRVTATSTAHLEQIVDRLLPYGHVTTSLILSSPVRRRNVNEPRSGLFCTGGADGVQRVQPAEWHCSQHGSRHEKGPGTPVPV